MIYKIRVILNTKEDIFRDIEIKDNQTLGELHQGIKTAFDFKGEEMASFYRADDLWNQGEEIPMEDFSDDGSGFTMFDLLIKDTLKNKKDRLLYVYDFMDMWSFYVQVLEINDKKPTLKYPTTIFKFGEMIEKAPLSNPSISIDYKEEDDDLEDPEFTSLDDMDLDNY